MTHHTRLLALLLLTGPLAHAATGSSTFAAASQAASVLCHPIGSLRESLTRCATGALPSPDLVTPQQLCQAALALAKQHPVTSSMIILTIYGAWVGPLYYRFWLRHRALPPKNPDIILPIAAKNYLPQVLEKKLLASDLVAKTPLPEPVAAAKSCTRPKFIQHSPFLLKLGEQYCRSNWVGPLPQELERILDDVHQPEKRGFYGDPRKCLQRMNARAINAAMPLNEEGPICILFEGRPGDGKTRCARTIAFELGVPYLEVCGSSFMTKWQGCLAENLRYLLDDARQERIADKPIGCVLFIDEFEGVGMKRDIGDNNHTCNDAVTTLLTETTIPANQGILILAATNHPEYLDEALTRPGRFGTRITFADPNFEHRKQLLNASMRTNLHRLEKHQSPCSMCAQLPEATSAIPNGAEASLEDPEEHDTCAAAISIAVPSHAGTTQHFPAGKDESFCFQSKTLTPWLYEANGNKTLEELAEATDGFSIAEIIGVINQTLARCSDTQAEAITVKDITLEIRRMRAEIERKKAAQRMVLGQEDAPLSEEMRMALYR